MTTKHAAVQVIWHDSSVSKADRHRLNNHKSCVLWFTGLSGSGKSTLANAVQQKLFENKVQTYVLDGDNIRHGLNQGLGFSDQDRQENIRRISEVAKLFVDAGMIVLTAFISPFRNDRDRARQRFEPGEFIEIYVRSPLEECEKRDPKGLYQKARNGEIPDFTGISSPYEEANAPELIIDTQQLTIEEAVNDILRYLQEKGIIL